MKEPKQKPKMEKPKLLEKPGAVARDARAILTEHYRNQAQERQAGSIGQQEDSPTEYATQHVETAARRGAAQAADTVRYGVKKTGEHYRDSRQANEENAYAANPQDGPNSPDPSPSKQQFMTQQKKNGHQEAHTAANAQPSQAGRSSAIRKQRAASPQEAAKRNFRLKRAKDVKLKQQSIRQASVRGEEQRELSSLQAAQRQKALSPQAGKKQAQSQISSRIQTTEQAKKRIRRASTAGVKSGKAAVKTAAYAKKQATKKARQAAQKEAIKRTAQAAKATAKFTVRVAKLVVKAAAALVKGLAALVGAGGAVLVLFLIVAAIAALIASPFGVFFSDEDKSADVTPISNVVQEVNVEFNQQIEDIKQAHSHVDSVEIHYPGSVDNIRVDNWMDVVAVFAVKTATDAENGMDVVTIDTTRIDLIKAVFWDMNSIGYEIETIEHTETETVENEDGTTSEITTTTYEYILHITITSKTAEQQADEYGFTADQKDILEGMLSGEFRPLMFTLLGMDGDIGLTPEQLQNLYNNLPIGELGAEIVRLALSRLGDPYSQPKAGQGSYTDCSYLAQWCYAEVGISIPRTAAAQGKYCVDNGLTISPNNLVPGDLVFFSHDTNGRFMNITHVAIYAGDGYIVDASSSKGQVVYRKLFSGQVLYGRPHIQ